MSTKKHTGSWFFMSVLIRIDYVNPAAAVKQVSSTDVPFSYKAIWSYIEDHRFWCYNM